MFSIHELRVVRFLSHLFQPTPPVDDRADWTSYADSLPRGPFVVWLAGQVATNLISEKPHHVSIDTLIAGVDDDTSGQMQHEAERFLEKQFGLFRYDPSLHRIIVVFRHVIQRKLKLLTHYQEMSKYQ